jgi:hypothetical protein
MSLSGSTCCGQASGHPLKRYSEAVYLVAGTKIARIGRHDPTIRHCLLTPERASLSNQQNRLDQRENLRKAIAGRKTEIERINRNLENLPAPGSSSRFGQPVQISQQSIDNGLRRRQEHEAALAELEREEARLAALGAPAGETLERDRVQSANALAPDQTQQKLAVNTVTFRTPYEGLKPEMKVVDFSNAMLAAQLTNKQYDCYSLANEYQRPMTEVEQRMGITRKTIHSTPIPSVTTETVGVG